MLPVLALLTPVASADAVRVFAAASLKNVFAAMAREIKPPIECQFSFAGSQVLAAQIRQGAPADVFASADRGNGDSVQGRPIEFARNRLVLVFSKLVRSPEVSMLARPGLKLLSGAPKSPFGKYAEMALDRLAKARGAEFAARVRLNIVSRELDVRSALAKVELGEADAAFVYQTDALSAGSKVVEVELPKEVQVEASYWVVPLSQSPDTARFVQRLLSPQGQRLLASYGFTKVAK